MEGYSAKDAVPETMPLGAFGPAPVHISVPHGWHPPNQEGLVCHFVYAPPPKGSFCDLGHGVHVSSPERCFVELTQVLSLDELILLGFELCGNYLFTASGKDGYTEVEAPLSSTAALRKMTEASFGTPGAPKAREALRWLLDKSRSPMGTIIEQRLVRTVGTGGYKSEAPQANAPFMLGKAAAAMAGRESFTCDLIWPEKRIVLECDSKEHHGDPEQAAYDAERASIIEFDNGNLISVTPRIEQNFGRFDAMVRRLFKLLGARYRKPTPEQMQKKLELRSRLYAAERRIKSL